MDVFDPTNPAFAELIDRLRRGDQSAATELVRYYEPELRRYVRMHLTDSRLRRYLDSLDICQSVWGRFFFAIAGGQFDLSNPKQLVALLLRMAHNEVCDQVRRQTSQRRNGGPCANVVVHFTEPASNSEADPSERLANCEMVQSLLDHLPESERYVASQRMLGRGWGELASELQIDSEVLRKRFTRASDKAARELGMVQCAT